jgi:hypothetical protein
MRVGSLLARLPVSSTFLSEWPWMQIYNDIVPTPLLWEDQQVYGTVRFEKVYRLARFIVVIKPGYLTREVIVGFGFNLKKCLV